VAATNRNPLAESLQGRFRQDLYYRLSVMPLMLPPLRERCGDIRLLAEHFVRQFEPRGHEVKFTPAALRKLREHPWPGNVRELRNVVQRALLLRHGPMLDAPALSFEQPPEPAPGTPARLVQVAGGNDVAAAAGAGGARVRGGRLAQLRLSARQGGQSAGALAHLALRAHEGLGVRRRGPAGAAGASTTVGGGGNRTRLRMGNIAQAVTSMLAVPGFGDGLRLGRGDGEVASSFCSRSKVVGRASDAWGILLLSLGTRPKEDYCVRSPKTSESCVAFTARSNH